MKINSEEYSETIIQEMQSESPVFPEFLPQVQFRVNNPQNNDPSEIHILGYSINKVNPITLT